MKRFIESQDRAPSALLPERLDDFVQEDKPVRVIDVFVDELELGNPGFTVTGGEQVRAAELFGVTQPRISDLMRGKVSLFSLDTLIDMTATAGMAPMVKVTKLKVLPESARCKPNWLPPETGDVAF